MGVRLGSVRLRVTLAAAGLCAVGLAVASFALVRAIHDNLTDEIERTKPRAARAGRGAARAGDATRPAASARRGPGRHTADLDNACRHANGNVAVALGTSNGHVELVVDDDGPGIPTDDRARIFDRFTRLDEGRARDAGGAGLGLAMVLAIVERHDGTVIVDDAPSGGARFTVRLPSA